MLLILIAVLLMLEVAPEGIQYDSTPKVLAIHYEYSTLLPLYWYHWARLETRKTCCSVL